MALEGPQLRYARGEDTEQSEQANAIAQALELARRIEELLEASPSIHMSTNPTSPAADLRSTRMARAMAASLIDELEALVRGTRKSGAA